MGVSRGGGSAEGCGMECEGCWARSLGFLRLQVEWRFSSAGGNLLQGKRETRPEQKMPKTVNVRVNHPMDGLEFIQPGTTEETDFSQSGG